MNKSKKIFIHGLFSPYVILLLFFQPWLLKKSVWIIWGADLYAFREERKTIRQKFSGLVRAQVIRNINEIMPIVEGDFKLAQKWYNTKAKYRYNMRYLSNLDIIHTFKQSSKEEGKDKIKILVGNSATKTNNHFEVFKLLKRFKEENIELIVPLSYGDREYREEVIEVGKKIFGDRFIPLTEFIEKKQYIELLSTIDVAILNNDRQQGMGNVSLLMYFGKKVFIRPGTTMWDTLHERYYIFSIEDIHSLTFENLPHYSKEQVEYNKSVQASRFDINSVIDYWNQVFQAK